MTNKEEIKRIVEEAAETAAVYATQGGNISKFLGDRTAVVLLAEILHEIRTRQIPEMKIPDISIPEIVIPEVNVPDLQVKIILPEVPKEEEKPGLLTRIKKKLEG